MNGFLQSAEEAHLYSEHGDVVSPERVQLRTDITTKKKKKLALNDYNPKIHFQPPL